MPVIKKGTIVKSSKIRKKKKREKPFSQNGSHGSLFHSLQTSYPLADLSPSPFLHEHNGRSTHVDPSYRSFVAIVVAEHGQVGWNTL